jgi:hypothetical protein
MSEPVIPPLELASDSSEMGTHTQDTYGLHFEVTAPEPWEYQYTTRFPDYDPQIVVSMLVDNAADALCASFAIARTIVGTITSPTRAALSGALGDNSSPTCSWQITIPLPSGSNSGVVIGPDAPLVFDLTNITPNDVSGSAAITLAPRLKARGTGKPDVEGTPLVYTVEKTAPPIVIQAVQWSPPNQAGRGTLSWIATGGVRECLVSANGEVIGKPIPGQANSQYSANLILQPGTRALAITAADANHNTATWSTQENFANSSPYFSLKVSQGRPAGLVCSDQTETLYGSFPYAENSGHCGIWQNTQSGTQDNWEDYHITLPDGAATSPCVYYAGNFYLAGGSAFDPGGFGSAFLAYDLDNTKSWQAIEAPSGWTEPRIGQAVTLFDEAIWVAGGYGASGKVYPDVFSYTRGQNGTGQWTEQPPLPQPRCNASLASAGGQLYLYGGYTDMPGGNARSDLCRLADGDWTVQHADFPDGFGKVPDYWCLGSLGGTLYLLASFSGRAATFSLASGKTYWQSVGGGDNLANVALSQDTQPPYGLSAVAFGRKPQPQRLFFVMADTSHRSAFAYYEPPSQTRALREV